MRQIVDIAQHILGDVRELLQAQLEDPERYVLVFGAVVLHQRCRHEHVVAGSGEDVHFYYKVQKKTDTLR